MSKMVSTYLCKKHLALIWFIGGIFLFLLFALQSILGKYGNGTAEAWNWFLPSIMPSLSLVLGVIVLDVARGGSKKTKIDRFIYHLVFFLSIIYLLLVVSIPLLQPLTGTDPLELMKRSNLWLAPFQGLVSAGLGIFFVKGEGVTQ
jgi:hypothetical protein